MPNYFKADYKTIRARLKHIDWTKELSDSFDMLWQLSIEGCIPRYDVSGKKHNIYMNTNVIHNKTFKAKTLEALYKNRKCVRPYQVYDSQKWIEHINEKFKSKFWNEYGTKHQE